MTGFRSAGAALFVSVIAAGSAASAQLPAAGDLDPGGRVLAKVSVTMTEPNAFGHPASGVRFLVVNEGGDRISIRTDDAGMASAWLRPGTYRFVTPDVFSWQGSGYTWDLVVPIRGGSGVIRLSQANATKSAQPVAASPGASIQTAVPAMEPVVPERSSTGVTTAHATIPQSRQGAWFNIGLGYGVFGCKDCDGTLDGLTGGLVLGGTLSPRFLLGVGTTGWTKSENGVTLTVGTLDARFRFYPSATGGFFVTGGVGVGSISGDVSGFGSETETGVGVVLGIGIDLRIAKNVSITPFWNGFAVQASNDDANVGQLGLGLTFH
jgi:outer membrane protein with beta-barrel domain